MTMILPNKHHHDDQTERKTNWKLKQRSSKVSLIMIDNQLYIHPFHSIHPKMLLLVFHVSVPHASSFISLSITGCLTDRVCVFAQCICDLLIEIIIIFILVLFRCPCSFTPNDLPSVIHSQMMCVDVKWCTVYCRVYTVVNSLNWTWTFAQRMVKCKRSSLRRLSSSLKWQSYNSVATVCFEFYSFASASMPFFMFFFHYFRLRTTFFARARLLS